VEVALLFLCEIGVKILNDMLALKGDLPVDFAYIRLQAFFLKKSCECTRFGVDYSVIL